NIEDLIHEFTSVLPDVIQRLADDGSIRTILNNSFPLHNIAYRCFLDGVDWMGCDMNTQFRYKDPTTVRFWRIGYRLFKGKFLRYMNGVNDRSDGISNFIIQTKDILNMNSAIKDEFLPGINVQAIGDIAEKDIGSMKTRKIVVIHMFSHII
ncbi:unnamed protein product, partial [Owenia fusiformis]